MFVNVRSCHKHYIMRTYGVPSDLPCEQCGAKQALEMPQYLPQIHNEPLPQFIWSKKNYLEKMWTDLKFLNENIFLRKILPDIDTDFNPLLLSKNKLELFSSEYKGRFLNGEKAIETLNHLRGQIEQVRNILFMREYSMISILIIPYQYFSLSFPHYFSSKSLRLSYYNFRFFIYSFTYLFFTYYILPSFP